MEATIIKCFLPDLMTAISDYVMLVSDRCLATALTVHRRLLQELGSSGDKTRILVLSVTKSIECDSRCFMLFLNVLKQELPLPEIRGP